MIVALVEDLMLRSRVSTAARAAGAEVRFASGADQVMALAAEAPPLIIIDLNTRRTDAVALVLRLKADRALAGLRVLGFVAHVDAAVIAAARQAGIDEVLARGAFVDRLPDILSALPPPPALAPL